MSKSKMFIAALALFVSTSAHAFTGDQDAVVMPVSYGSHTNDELAFMKIEGETAHKLFDAMEGGQMLRKDLAETTPFYRDSKLGDIQERMESQIIRAKDGTGECIKLTTVTINKKGRQSSTISYGCSLWLQPIPK